MRGISILLVLVLHFTPGLMPGGYFGVDIFFVLSGFLITSLLLHEWTHTARLSLKDFYVRRALRLGPALLVYLLALGGYAFIYLKPENARDIYVGIALTLSYVSNWVIALKPDFPPGILAITWSLAVEEQFYLLWPLLLSVLLRLKLKPGWIIGLLALGFCSVTLHRTLLWAAGASVRRMYYATDTHADGLLLGCIVGCLVTWNLLPQSRLLEICCKCLAVVASLFIGCLTLTVQHTNGFLYAGGFSLASFAIALVLIVLIAWPPALASKLLRLGPLVWVGRVSYGLYLWHWPVRGFVFGKSVQPSVKQIIAAVVLSFGITAISFYLIEQPFLRRKKRFSHA